MADGLSDVQVEKFNKDGYLVLDGFFSVDEVEEMKARMNEILDNMDLSDHPKSIFTTGESQLKTMDDYFITSADKIRYFFEEGAFDEQGVLVKDKHKAVNKVGHALHALDPVFKKFTFSPRIQAIAKSVHMKRPNVPQSMYIFKQPGIGGEVVPHRDSSFLYTDPPTTMGFWIPLEDCTLENGCLWFIPGSHTDGVKRRFVRNSEGKQPLMAYDAPAEEFEDSRFIPALTKRGTLVIIHGAVAHRSLPNVSEKSRHAYTFHIVEGENTEYSKQNWLQPTAELPFPPLYSEA